MDVWFILCGVNLSLERASKIHLHWNERWKKKMYHHLDDSSQRWMLADCWCTPLFGFYILGNLHMKIGSCITHSADPLQLKQHWLIIHTGQGAPITFFLKKRNCVGVHFHHWPGCTCQLELGSPSKPQRFSTAVSSGLNCEAGERIWAVGRLRRGRKDSMNTAKMVILQLKRLTVLTGSC